MRTRDRLATIVLAAGLSGVAAVASAQGLASADLHRLKSVGDVQLSADGRLIAYSVQNHDRPGTPYGQIWIRDLTTGQTRRLGTDSQATRSPRWSPDGRQVAFLGRDTDRASLMIARADGTDLEAIAEVSGTNHPLPSSGESLAWSPDGTRIAFISAAPGPEAEANGDPMVITRYLYKPTASEGLTRFNDNRRLHIFVADLRTKRVQQLTDGVYYEHSIEWSPKGDEILFVSNRGPDPDRFFNYDIFAVAVVDGSIRRLTDTKSAEYRPTWSPDGRTIAFIGTTRPLTSSETTMEDTHVWLMASDGTNRRELGKVPDNRQGAPQWSGDGTAVYATVQQRGSTALYRFPVSGGAPEAFLADRGSVGTWSVASNNAVAYAFTSPGSPSELYLKAAIDEKAVKLTTLNDALLGKAAVAAVDAFTFRSFDGTEIEAFFTIPVTLPATPPQASHPMIVMIHGGPHGQQGPAFNHKAQVYAAQGWGVLMVNYRGSTGYGQNFTDAIFKDQNGGEAKDVLAGVDAALRRYPWLDPNRLGIEGGSYGGQLTNWLITQTDRFAAAIPAASISNLVSFNYTAYYHDYLAVEFGSFPHENGVIDLLWERSPIRYAAKVKTPTMLVHGENDNDVPIAEAEQFYIALHDVGVEAIMVRYPREGHGIRETRHVIDVIDRSVAWYQRHFARREQRSERRD